MAAAVTPETFDGYLLQASYRISGGVPVVYLFGRLDSGGTFLFRDHQQRPSFHIHARDVDRARALGAHDLVQTSQRTMTGELAARVEVTVPQDAPPLRDRLQSSGIETFEADVRFAMRYLIDRNVRGRCRIEGARRAGDGVDWVFDDARLLPGNDGPCAPTVLSFDIETDGDAEALLAISLYGCGADEVYIVDSVNRPMPERAVRCADERAALDAFCRRVAELDPDVLTGWNVIDFDLSVLARVAARVRHPFQLGREPGALRVRAAQGYFGSGQASIPGRLVLDGMDLLRGAFVRMDDYSLDAVARSVLGEGKALTGEATDRVGEILHNYRHDLPAFARYARVDARLVLDILDRLSLVDLAFARSRLTGMTPDRVAASIASFDFLYLSELRRRGIVAPSVRRVGNATAQGGGHVFEPVTGLHRNVWVFDFKSLYPSIIRTFNIDPLTIVHDPAPTGASSPVVTLTDTIGFSREPGILPAMLDRLFPEREAAKRRGDGVASQAIKILMNSFYGVLGTPACRFYNPDLANAITGTGRRLLQWSRRWFEDLGFEVLYGDTDSVFVGSGIADAGEAQAVAASLEERMNRELAEHILDRYGVTSRLELEFEKLYDQLFLPSVRGGDSGARKRYAGVLYRPDAAASDERSDVEFVGMEVVRRDWTELAKTVQRELYARLFAGEPVDEYLKTMADELRQGHLDDLLVYRKGLRKPLDSYTASSPPHVVAARKLPGPPGRVINYVWTVAGPEPTDALQHAPDHEHYLERQIKPVAEPVLGALGQEFARVIGDERQIELF